MVFILTNFRMLPGREEFHDALALNRVVVARDNLSELRDDNNFGQRSPTLADEFSSNLLDFMN